MKPIKKFGVDYNEDTFRLPQKIDEVIDAVNELMPKGFDCKQGRHDKCYSIFADCTYPSTRYWICRICGKRGADTEPFININEYDELVKKFKEDK